MWILLGAASEIAKDHGIASNVGSSVSSEKGVKIGMAERKENLRLRLEGSVLKQPLASCSGVAEAFIATFL